MGSSLRHTTVNALIWSSVERFGTLFIQLVANIILARILLPDDFGLVGMITVFIAISTSLIDCGLGTALVQKKNPNQSDFSTIFYVNIILGITLFGILFFVAPYIAKFYKQEQLCLLLRVLGIILITNSFSIVHNAIISREIAFKKLSKINISATLTSCCIATICALNGFGVWSLVIQSLCISILRCALLWLMNSWRPKWIFDFSALSSLFGYGSMLMFAGLLDTIYQNIQPLIIGKKFTPSDLGFYTQANKLQDVPTQTVAAVVTQATFPIYSLLQDDDEKLKIGLRKSIKGLVFINFPLMILLAIIAKPLITIILTTKWLPSVPYFQLLCFSGMLMVLHSATLNIIKAKGRSDLFLYAEFIKKAFGIVAIIIGVLLYGIIGMITATVISSYISYIINAFISGKLIHYKLPAQIKDILPYYLLAFGVGFAIWSISFIYPFQPFILLSIQLIAYIILYIGVAHLFKMEAYEECIRIFKEQILVKIKHTI